VKRRLVITPQAKADLRDILFDVAEDSPDTAERLRVEMYEAFQRLGQSPGIGHYHDELLDRRYRFWNFYSYVVCYIWARKPVQIVAVVHGARDLAVLLSSRLSSD
jgi:plasmid stabilization system protein ParE